MDWTDCYNQKEIAQKANRLIDDLVTEIYGKNMPIFGDLDRDELALLCRWPVHIGTNLFIERLSHSFPVKNSKLHSIASFLK